MSKSKGEKTTEVKKPGGQQANPTQSPKGEHGGHSPSGQSAGHQKQDKNAGKVGCHATGCKDKDVRFNFCEEHFKQFKFGLITKSGDKVFDYERKFEHYQNMVRSNKAA